MRSNKSFKLAALFLCLIFVFECMPVVTFSADKTSRTLTNGGVTVTGDFSRRASLSAEVIEDPFVEHAGDPDPWWPFWPWNFRGMSSGGSRAAAALPSAENGSADTDTAEDELPLGSSIYYEISVRERGAEVHPETPVTVTVNDENIPAGVGLRVIHILDDADVIEKAFAAGKAAEITSAEFVKAFPDAALAAYEATGHKGAVFVEYFTTEDGTLQRAGEHAVSFVASSFSVFVITETELVTTIEASDGNTYNVTVTYDVRANIPSDAYLSVKELLEGDAGYAGYYAAAAEKMGYDAESMEYMRLFDISIIGARSYEHYKPSMPVKVSVTLSDRASGSGALSVVHFGDTPQLLESETDGGSVSYVTESFSVFALGEGEYLDTYKFYVPESAEQTSYREYTLYLGSEGLTTYTQIIKSGEPLVVPRLPSIESSTNSTFDAWYIGTGGSTSGGVTTGVTLSSEPFDFNNIPQATGTEYKLYARFATFAYVIFHEQYNGSTESWPITGTRRGEIADGANGATIRIGDVTVSYDDPNQQDLEPGTTPPPPAMAFRGWTTKDNVGADHTIPEDADVLSEYVRVELGNSLEVYPVFTSIHWISFSSAPAGSGATYFAPEFRYSDVTIPDLRAYVPARRGYTFAGWYTAEEGGVRVTDASGNLNTSASFPAESGLAIEGGELKLTKNVTVYGHWTPAPATYTIVIWRQSVEDDKDTTHTAEQRQAWYDSVLSQWLADNPGSSAGECPTKITDYPYPVKTYDFAESITVNSTSEAVATVANTYKQRSGGDYNGFYYDRCDPDTTVSGNGTTLLNVYYGRETVNYAFNRYDYAYTPTTDNNGTTQYYGYYDGSYLRIYNNNGTWYRTRTGSGWGGYSYSNPYTGTRYTRSYYESWNPVQVMTGLYGQFISKYGYEWPGQHYWREDYSGSSASGTGMTYLEAFNSITGHPNMSHDNETHSYTVNFYSSKEAGTRQIIHVMEDLDGNYSLDNAYTTYATGNANFNLTDKFAGYHVIGYRFGTFASNPSTYATAGESTGSSSSTLYVYHERNVRQLTFFDSYDQHVIATVNVKYGAPLAGSVPTAAPVSSRDGYDFSGWYYDKSCTTSFDFTKTMPDANMSAYAGWETVWYVVKIDPNGGALNVNETYSTWFWKEYATTESVIEYTGTRRDFLESLDGTWYYAVMDRDYYGLTDEWDPAEDNMRPRTTYYTQNIEDPAIVDLSVKYEQQRDAYRYSGWYEVHPDGTETLYNFSTRIDHSMTLRLHWKQVGTYYIRYEPGEYGTLDGNDSNEDTFKVLDDADFMDRSELIVTRTARANDSAHRNFIGWKIRGDSSNTLYHPGQTFEFLSRFAITQEVDGVERKYLVMDAVYTYIDTAKIVYDANGGAVDAENVDYGGPTDPSAPAPEYSSASGTATIMNLVNNSGVVLSDGSGFVRDNAVICGWNTAPDASGEHFDLGGSYYVDTAEPVRLYAEWGVKVYFDKNNENASWPTAAWEDAGYTWDAEREQYYARAVIGRPVAEPASALSPASSDPTETFQFWTLEKNSLDPVEYDFSAAITGETTIFGYWRLPIEIPVHAVDASDQTFVNKDAQWLRNDPDHIEIISDAHITLDQATAASFTQVPTTPPYSYAFTCVSPTLDGVSDTRAVTEIYYNSAARTVWVKYADGTEGRLGETDQIWFVYFNDPVTVNIRYKVMNQDGTLSDATMNRTGYPTTATLGTYAVNANGNVDHAMYWANNDSYKFYAYGVGAQNASNASQLRVITAASDSDGAASRPALSVKNAWNGFRYSVNGGAEWADCGREIDLYVIYYTTTAKPVVVTVNEITHGKYADLNELFDYTVEITETNVTFTRRDWYTRSGSYGNYTYTLVERGTPSNVVTGTSSQVSTSTFQLKSGESRPITLLYEETNTPNNQYHQSGDRYYRDLVFSATTQTVTVTQSPKAGFITENDGTPATPFVYTYTTDADSTNREVTFTNTRTPVTVEVHVAQVVGGNLVLKDDELRSSEPADYTLELAYGASVSLAEGAPIDPFTGNAEKYGFVGIVYGTRTGTAVTSADAAETVQYSVLSGRNYADTFINGTESLDTDHYEIYYVYYLKPRIVYVREEGNGALSMINPVRYNGLSITMNDTIVEQNNRLNVTAADFPFSQAGAGYRVPPSLDGTTAMSLDYIKLGVGDAGATSTAQLEFVSENRTLRLKVEDGVVKYSADGITYTPFVNEPVVYAIYRDRADNMLKIIRTDGAADQDFWYEIVTPHGNILSVCIPAGSDSVTVKGVEYGQYTVVEKGDWSWRYACEGSKNVRVYRADDTRPAGAMVGYTEVEFYGEKTLNDWLNGYAGKTNLFGSVSP